MGFRRYIIFIIGIIITATIFPSAYGQLEGPAEGVDQATETDVGLSVDGDRVNLYFLDQDRRYLTAEARTLTHAADASIHGRNIVEALIAGPQTGLLPTVENEAKIRAFYVTEYGNAYVDFADGIQALHPGGGRSELMAIYAVVNSLVLNVPTIESVTFLIDGHEAMSLAGHIDLRFPFKANMLLVR